MLETSRSHFVKARSIIAENKYMVLATSDKGAKPWASPVFFAHDEKYNFYFLSSINSRHAKNIIENPTVGIAIFDSRQGIGHTEGIQIEATAGQVGKNGLENAIGHYVTKAFPNHGTNMSPTERYNPKEYVEPSELRFFKVIPDKIYIQDIADRIEVNII